MALSDNCTQYYKLDEASGTLNDEVGTADLSASGSPTYHETGKVSYATKGDKSNYFGGSLTSPDIDKMSISFWFKGNTQGDGYALFSTWDASASKFGLRCIITGGTFYAQTGTAGYAPAASFSYTYDTNWHHCVITLDNGATKIYIDNGTAITGSWDGRSLTCNLLTIHHDNNFTTPTGIYTIDEFGVWQNRVLTSTEVSELYNSGNGLTYPFVTDVTYNATAFSLSFTSKTPSYFLTKSINSALALNLTLNSFSSAIISLQLSTPAGTKGTEAIRKDRWGKTPTSFKSFGEKLYYQV